ESQRALFEELRAVLAQIGDAAPSEPRVRIAALARTAGEVLDWCASVQQELLAEGGRAARGEQQIDLLGLCQDVLHDCGEAFDRPIQLAGFAVRSVWGSVATLGRLVRLAVELVAARTAGTGSILLGIGDDERGPFLHLHSDGQACADPSAQQVA